MSSDAKDRIDAIWERVEKATPGPWMCATRENAPNEAGDTDFGGELATAIERTVTTEWEQGQLKARIPIIGIASSPYYERPQYLYAEHADTEFIAHAREDVPFLLDHIAALERALLDSYHDIPGAPGGTDPVPWTEDEVDSIRPSAGEETSDE